MKRTIDHGDGSYTVFTGTSEKQLEDFLEYMKESGVTVIEEDDEDDGAIEIVFRNGDMVHYAPDEYTDYKYDGKYFVVIRERQWIGFYNLDCVEHIEVGKGEK